MLPIKYCLQQSYHLSLILIISIAFALPIFAQTGIPVGSMSQCDTQMQTFLNNYQMPGATFAITKNGRLIYMRAFGTANRAGTEATQPYHMFRIASISKPITSIAIMKLIENGQLSLSDKPFGPGGILNVDPYFANANITDTRVYDITIQNLLEHSAGWNRDLPMPPGPLSPYPFPFGGSDPIDFPLHVTQTLGEANPVTRRAMIKFLIQKGLNFTPGTAYKYSNIGFLVLGEVIEKKTGLTYENYVKQNIFAPLGIYDIRLGKNLLADKLEREVEYITNPTFTSLSAYGTGQFVPLEYGGVSVEAMDAHGGWIATSRDLLRLLAAVDGFPSRPDILSATTLQTMTTPSANNSNYAKGWEVNFFNNWWHTGALHGTASIMVRTNSQYTWAVLLNGRSLSSGFWNALDGLGWNCVNSTVTFPTHDLFDVPTQNASAMNFSNITSNSISVNWTNGNGDGRVLIMRAGGAPNKFPLDGTEYATSPQADLGDGNYVVYSGTGNNTTVSNLNGNTNYQFRLYEYKKNANTGNYALYQLANAASGSQNTLGTTSQRTRFDFDGDGKADISVFRNGNWYIQGSISGFSGRNWGFATDIPAPADFDGDGKTDVSVFRDGNWYWINSSNNQFNAIQFGQNGDIPVPADFDGDGKADISVFRPTNGTWYRLNSSQNNQFFAAQFGATGDKPIIGDFDGDGKSDLAVTRATNGNLNWYWMESSTNQFRAVQWGFATDIAAPADFDGDGKTDVSVFRPSNGNWYRLNSGQNNQLFAIQFGQNGDVPVAADYDGDGKADVAVFRAGNWYRLNSSNGAFFGQQFGITEDKAIPSAFLP
jgi:CubicO group peptidase (beta-lactamase class C family)